MARKFLKKEDLTLPIIKDSIDFIKYFVKYCYIKEFLKEEIALDKLVHLCKQAYKLGLNLDKKTKHTKEEKFIITFRNWLEGERRGIKEVYNNLDILAEKSDLFWFNKLKEYNSVTKDIKTPNKKEPLSTPDIKKK